MMIAQIGAHTLSPPRSNTKVALQELLILVARSTLLSDERSRIKMKEILNNFWGKISTDESGTLVSWQPLEAHCADVAAVTEALLNNTILNPRLAFLIDQESLSEVQIDRLCILAALHDVGKVNHGFQDRAYSSDAPHTGHVSPLIDFMDWNGPERDEIIAALALGSICEWFESEDDCVAFLLATFSHHGKPVRPSPHFRPALWRANRRRNPIQEMRTLSQAARRWFPHAFDASVPPFPHSTEFQHVFNGLLTLADWIGSDEQFFPYANDHSDRMPFARQRAREALVQLGLAPRQSRTSLGPDRPGFAAIAPAGYLPHPIQQECANLPNYENGSLTILESDTGSGKTEAALTRFVQLFHTGLVDGMYFALPTRTAATQIHTRVTEAVARTFPDPSYRPAVVLAVPGYLKVDETTGQQLPPFDVLWNDDDHDRWRYRGWAAESPKRYLAGTIVVGTIDQVLLSTLQVNHAHLRATALLRHLLIVDEVHASDTYMGRLLQEVITHHLQAGGHAFLMSATLGTVAQARLLNAAPTPPPPLKEAREMAYPLISYTDAHRKKVKYIQPLPSGYTKRVAVQIEQIVADPSKVASLALDAATSGARVLIIRNTVRDCIATQLTLEHLAGTDSNALFSANGVVAPHHSRFARPDRESLDRAIEEQFGKNSQQGGVVAVATQTVQQSLDLDADLLFSDLCPVDVLLQRIGRLHRHPKKRPPESRPQGYRTARTIVLVPEERSLESYIRPNGRAFGPHGLGTVYEDLRTLEATWRLIEEHDIWVIPEMNRELVEMATHPEALSKIVHSLGGVWAQHEAYVLGRRGADRTHANLLLLPREKPFGEDEFPRDLDERIKTRLGEGDCKIDLGAKITGPFGNEIQKLTLPYHYAPDADDEATTENIVVEHGTVRFDFAGKTFIYDRLGLRPIDTNYKEDPENG